jgi:hypothetical protein
MPHGPSCSPRTCDASFSSASLKGCTSSSFRLSTSRASTVEAGRSVMPAVVAVLSTGRCSSAVVCSTSRSADAWRMYLALRISCACVRARVHAEHAMHVVSACQCCLFVRNTPLLHPPPSTCRKDVGLSWNSSTATSPITNICMGGRERNILSATAASSCATHHPCRCAVTNTPCPAPCAAGAAARRRG